MGPRFCQSRGAGGGAGPGLGETRQPRSPPGLPPVCGWGPRAPEGAQAGRGASRQGWARLRGLTDALSHRRAERVPQEKVHRHGCRCHQPVISADSNRQRRRPVT